MISERPRNLLVGLTMLVALGVFMYGIFLLGKFPQVGGLRPYEVTLMSPNANGVTAGSQVQVNGVYAGQVKNVYLTPDASGKLVAKVILTIDRNVKIPQAATAVLSKPQTVGNPFVSIEISDTTGPMVAQDGTGTLKAIAGETGLIPQQVFNDVTALSKELQTVAHDLHMLLAYASPEDLAKANPNDPNRPRENASTVIIRLNRTIDSLQKLLTDPELQGNVRAAIQNIAEASSKLKTTLDKINLTVTDANGALNSIGSAATQASSTLVTTQVEIARLSQKLVETLSQLQKTVRDISEGPGTTGRLVQDPRLYDSLLDLSKSLKSTVDNLNFLIDKWKDEGVNLKLK